MPVLLAVLLGLGVTAKPNTRSASADHAQGAELVGRLFLDAWYAAEGDRTARDSLTPKMLAMFAVQAHNACKKERALCGQADEAYAAYLGRFAGEPEAYHVRFFWAELLNDQLQDYERAADQYEQVAAYGAPHIFQQNAAYGAVVALDAVVEAQVKAGLPLPSPSEDPRVRIPLSRAEERLLGACDAYVRSLPEGPKAIEVAYQGAFVLYRHHYFEEAVPRFSRIAVEHPVYRFENGDWAAEQSADLILDSYNLLGDYQSLSEWARRLADARPAIGGPRFGKHLAGILEQSEEKQRRAR